MIRYLIRRVLWAVVLFLAVTVVTYVIFFIVPADPAKLVAGRGAGPDDIVRARHFLGVDRQIYVQYGKILWRLVGHQSLGHSFTDRHGVYRVAASPAPV